MTIFENLLSRLDQLGLSQRLILIIVVAVGAHLLVLLVRKVSAYWLQQPAKENKRKLLSVVSLITSSLIFIFYFSAIGFILSEFGVPITTYFASATIIGLAVGFGSQGLVQDVVSGLTTIFSDVFDVGDVVEISGQVGVVRNIGLRFVEIENTFGARVLIPNRTITNVINYRRGYIRCIVDVTLSEPCQPSKESLLKQLDELAIGVHEQFPGILITLPSIEGEKQTTGGRSYYRIKFRIWPGRGTPIEQSFKPEVIQKLKQFDDKYMDWMVAVHYEVEMKKRF